ncbi:MBL fold metallo-hydrolase [Microbacteriaceae bacterium]|nr:MBL fold metallo-hydrolase [Candidatus Saccharibacteria bacterium]
MFEVEYKGGNGVVISNKKTTITVDPKLSLVGSKDLKTQDQVELLTENRFRVDNPEARLIIESPGEYEVGDFTIRAIAAQRHIDTSDEVKLSTIYRLETTEVRVALVGNIDPKLSEEQLEGLGVVDILILPVGGNGYTLDATSAATIVRQVGPKVVIPIHYQDSGLRYEVAQDPLEYFVKELGAPLESVTKYKIKSASVFPAVLTIMELARV